MNFHPTAFDDEALDAATFDRSPVESVAPAVDPAADQTERQLELLASLAETAHTITLVMKDRVVLAAAEGKTDDKAVKACALAGKTMQQVILLHREIKEHREKRRAQVASGRKAQAKQIVRAAIDRPDPSDAPPQEQRTEKVRAVQRVTLETMFKTVDDELVARLSVAELVQHACRLCGLPLDPALRWPEWAELRGEPSPEPPAEPAARPAKTKPTVPAHLSGASSLGLNGRAPPDPPFAGPRERAPP